MAEALARPPNKFLVLLTTTTVQALVTMNVVIPAAIAPEMAAMLEVEPAMVGIQIGIAYFGAAALSAMSGTVVRRWGALRASQLALMLSAVGAALMAVPSLGVLAVGAVFCGLGYALTNPPASHLLARVTTPTDRNFLFSVKQTSVPLGGVAAGFMAPPVALTWGPQAPLIVGVAVTVAVALAMQPLRWSWDADRDPAHSLKRNPLTEMAIMWHERRLRYYGFVAFCFAAMQLCLTTFTVTMLVTDLGFGLIEAGIILAILQIAGVTGRLWWGWLADRIRDGNAALLMIALLSVVFALATSALTAQSPHVWVYALMALFSFAAVGWNGVFMAEIARIAPVDATSKATGAVLVVSFAGILVGPPAFTATHAVLGSYTATFGVFAGVSALGGIYLCWLRRWERRHHAAQ